MRDDVVMKPGADAKRPRPPPPKAEYVGEARAGREVVARARRSEVRPRAARHLGRHSTTTSEEAAEVRVWTRRLVEEAAPRRAGRRTRSGVGSRRRRAAADAPGSGGGWPPGATAPGAPRRASAPRPGRARVGRAWVASVAKAAGGRPARPASRNWGGSRCGRRSGRGHARPARTTSLTRRDDAREAACCA